MARQRKSSPPRTPAADRNGPPRPDGPPPPPPSEATDGRGHRGLIDLDSLDLSGLLAHAESLLEGLETYQRRAEVAGFRVNVGSLVAFSGCRLAAHKAVTKVRDH